MKRPKLKSKYISTDFQQKTEPIGHGAIVFYDPHGNLQASLAPQGEEFPSDRIVVDVIGPNSHFLTEKIRKFLLHLFPAEAD